MILEGIVIVGFALLLDFLIGDPKTKYHPTAWIGKLIAVLVPFTRNNSPMSSAPINFKKFILAYPAT